MRVAVDRRGFVALGAVLALLAGPRASSAADDAPAVGRLASADGTLLRRGKPDQPWQAVNQKGELHAGELLVGLPPAVIESRDGSVRLTLLTDMDKNSPYPILEAAVVLHESAGFDLDFTLDRGRVDVRNLKQKGAARVRVRFHDQKWEATLAEPGAHLALELYGRWAPGTRFTTEPGPKDVPAADLVLLVRKGRVEVSHSSCTNAMSAPPGPALLHWDNGDEPDEAPQKLDALPDWAATDESTTERAQRLKKVLDELRQEIVRSSPQEAARQFARSDDPNHRATGVIVLGAMDDLEGLGDVITGTKYPDAWDRAVVVIRHWLGRKPGQDQVLYQMLTDKRGLPPARAAGILQLLHSFSAEDLAHPEVYRMLVKYLDSDHLGIRGLAHWHLVRLVPAGREFGFDPLGPRDKRDKARDEWKKLIEGMLAKGELPPKRASK